MKLIPFILGLMAAVQISHGAITADEARAIAKEAVIYGFPLVGNYRVHYSYFVDTGSPEYKAPWNHLTNTPRVFTPEDKAIQTPNSDTPYSFIGIDLRAEPIVITVPAMPAERYFSVQLIDAYTHNFAYIGSLTIGNAGGHFLITGTGWHGTKPKGITKLFHCETSFAWGLIRTQLFQPDDLGKVKEIQTAGKLTSGQVFGTREFLKNNYLYRMTAAVLGIYGNSREEAIYPTYFTDANGAKLNGADGRYTLRFAPGQLPPVNSFWSLTLYELPSSLLSANSLNRYLINSHMLPGLLRDDDGGITLHIQHESPGKDREANWLPAPAAPFWMSLRLYWPKEEALTGAWKQPAAVPAPR
jgi:hypothetical protein